MMMMMITATMTTTIITTTTTTTTATLKGVIRDFYNLLTAPRTVSNTYAQVVRPQSCVNHVQHQITGNTSSAYRVQHVVCHVVRKDSSAMKPDTVETAIIVA